jgi:hypothetical protein
MLSLWSSCARFRAVGFDEESERDLWIHLVHQACYKSMQAIETLAQEQEILYMMLRRLDEDVDSASRKAEGLFYRLHDYIC